MTETKIKTSINQIDHIIHISDIHIRNLKRHKEYRCVFNNLYKKCRKLVKQNPNTLIYLGGDIAHTKTEMSPELIDMIQDFFKSLAVIAPTILIAGNHDCNLNNESRLDALTPIVKSLDHPNFHYLRESGVYDICGIKFIVWSVFDYTKFIIDPKEVEGDYKIVLFHGPLNLSENDFGFQMNNNKIGIEQFDGCTLGLLGDIHKYQYMNSEKTVAYPGSLIQQNHAETLKGHGLLYWDIKNKTSEFIEVKNDWGYVTLVIDGGELPDTKQLPKKPRIRIKYTDTDHSELKEILTEIKKKYEVQDVVLYRQDTLSSVKSGDRDMSYNMGNIRDVSYQNKLIKDYLDRHYGVEESLMKRIYEINNDLNKKLPTADIGEISFGHQRNLNFQICFHMEKIIT